MKYKMKTMMAVMMAVLAATLASNAAEAPKLTHEATLEIMQKAATWQLANPSKHPPTDWTHGALYDGMMALGDLSADPKYRAAMMSAGQTNDWQPGKNVYHADDYCVGQMYCEMYSLYRDPGMIAPLRDRFNYILANPSKGPVEEKTKAEGIPAGLMRWWWCDALFMGPPAWIRLYAVTGEEKYLNFMIQEWWATSDFLFDKEEQLYFRDKGYFTKKEANGKKVFWSRGNGWVMGGLVRVLQVLPSDHPERKRFVEQFQQMAERLTACQQADGLWRSSLLDPASYPNPETSGSGFDCYAMIWGINQGLLNRAKFEPVIQKAWAGLVGCVAEDGKLTHVQPIGADPRTFDTNSSEIYGVGAFLLAGSELYRMQLLHEVPNTTISVRNDLDQLRTQETVEISLAALKAKLPGVTAENVAVMDSGAARWITSQVLDENGDGQPDKLLFQSDFLPRQKKSFVIFAGIDRAKLPAPALTTTARFVPERADDFAWENDRIAFRMYGPALQKQDGDKTGSGVDVWCKHVREPVVNSMYKRKNYHNDDSKAADNYRAGAHRGCGGAAIWSDGKLCGSRCFKTWKVVAEGPIRAVFELTYAPWDANGRQVSEVIRVSLDLGENLNRFECRYDTGNQSVTVAAGLFIHSEDSLVTHEDNWASIWEKFSEGDGPGFIPVGLVWPATSGGRFEKADGHALVLRELNPGEPFFYYAGAGWSKGLDFKNSGAWNGYVKDFTARLKAPLKVEIP
jgi:unsaturated rhamnogalacturonyl hydrolase